MALRDLATHAGFRENGFLFRGAGHAAKLASELPDCDIGAMCILSALP